MNRTRIIDYVDVVFKQHYNLGGDDFKINLVIKSVIAATIIFAK